ncbi:MAG: uroporphyrinogen-III synthase [Alphaproteobacteria bacterium]|nr:MAG: uroporphyrinogen-III synthase [Alphaproteobacteria bacterium]
MTEAPDPVDAEHLPTLLLTRPADRARAFLRKLETRLSPMPEVVIAPVMAIRPLPLPEGLARYRGVILTSAQAARLVSGLSDVPAFVVGEETARAARAAGLDVQAVAETAAELLALLGARRPVAPLIHLRGAQTRLSFAEKLSSAGTETHEAVIYAQEPVPLSEEARALLARSAPIVAPLFSPMSAALLADRAQGALAELHLVAMSAGVAEAWRQAWQGPEPARLSVLPAPTSAAMVDHVAGLYRHWAG